MVYELSFFISRIVGKGYFAEKNASCIRRRVSYRRDSRNAFYQNAVGIRLSPETLRQIYRSGMLFRPKCVFHFYRTYKRKRVIGRVDFVRGAASRGLDPAAGDSLLPCVHVRRKSGDLFYGLSYVGCADRVCVVSSHSFADRCRIAMCNGSLLCAGEFFSVLYGRFDRVGARRCIFDRFGCGDLFFGYGFAVGVVSSARESALIRIFLLE